MSDTDLEYIKLRDEFTKELKPKTLKSSKDCWEFYINSSSENMERYQKSKDEVCDLYKNEKLYNDFKSLEEKGVKDKHLSKQLHDLIRDFDEELNTGALKKRLRDKEDEIATKFNSYTPIVDGKDITGQIQKLLEVETDVSMREKIYNAKIKSADLIADDLVELVKIRNEFAKTKGYPNFYEYTLKEIYDVESNDLQKLLDEVYETALKSNKKIQEETKKKLACEYGIEPKDLKAYHYGLILKSDPAKLVNESIKTKEQVVELAKKTYKNMGYSIEKMPIVLDLFPRKNKNTHGFCFDIEAGKDARILANLTNNVRSIDTLLHELGHCIYHLGISDDLSFFDQTSYPAMTEAVAMLMGDLVQTEDILEDFVDKNTLSLFKNDHKKSEVKFITRSMLIINFEKLMYENPTQDLKKLWHDLKVKYTSINPDDLINNEWAAIPHYLSHPAYYQNYFRADLIKAQMYKYMKSQLGYITRNIKTSTFLNKNLFRYGTSLEESKLIYNFTKENLSTTALCQNLNFD